MTDLELIVAISEKYARFFGEIFDTLEDLKIGLEKHGIEIGATWEEFGIMLVEIFDNNMWSEVIAVREIKLLTMLEPLIFVEEDVKFRKARNTERMKSYHDALGFDQSKV